MLPLLAGAFVAASLASSLYTNSQQKKLERTGIDVEVEQARLQASEAALERTKRFRQNASMNLALHGMGFGSGQNIAGGVAEGFENYMGDINALNRAENYAMLGGKLKRSASRTNSAARNLGALESSAGLAAKLGLFGG